LFGKLGIKVFGKKGLKGDGSWKTHPEFLRV